MDRHAGEQIRVALSISFSDALTRNLLISHGSVLLKQLNPRG
jgi:hypothetical protein